MAGGSKSSQTSKPKDMTPEAFAGLQSPLAFRFMQLMGFNPQMGGGGGGTELPGADPLDNPILKSMFGGRQNTPFSGFRGGGAFASGGGGGSSFNFGGGEPGGLLSGIPTWEGPFAADLAGNEQAMLDQLMQSTGSQQAGFGTSRDFLGRTLGGEFLDAGNPFLRSAIEAAQRPTLQGLEETLSRTLPGRFTQAGHFAQPEGSSAFDRAAAVATRGAAQEMGDIASEMSFGAHEAERGRQQEAAGMLPGVQAQEVNTMIQNLQAQALPRLIEQAGIEGGIESFNRQVQNLMQVLGMVSGTSAPVIANSTSGSSRTKPNVVGPLLS